MTQHTLSFSHDNDGAADVDVAGADVVRGAAAVVVVVVVVVAPVLLVCVVRGTGGECGRSSSRLRALGDNTRRTRSSTPSPAHRAVTHARTRQARHKPASSLSAP
jgi:hypothetical protein